MNLSSCISSQVSVYEIIALHMMDIDFVAASAILTLFMCENEPQKEAGVQFWKTRLFVKVRIACYLLVLGSARQGGSIVLVQ